MSVAEATENKWIRDNACKRFDFLHRVENMVGEGTFDTFGIIMSQQMWIEIKAPIEPARHGTRLFSGNHEFTQGQKNFALSILRAGGLCWAFIGTNLRQMLIPGMVIEKANEMTVDQLVMQSIWHREKGHKDLRQSGMLLRHALAQRDPPKYWDLE
jgi:hypothetical protein